MSEVRRYPQVLMQLTGWSVAVPVALAALVGCGDPAVVSDAPLTDAQVAAVLADATLGEEDLPGAVEWEVSEDDEDLPAYLEGCAATASELVGTAPGAVSTSRSEVYVGGRLGETGDLSDPTWVRVLGETTVFDDEAGAAAAAAQFDEVAFAACLEDGIASDIRGYEDETADAGDLERVEFEARSADVGDSSVLHSAYFSATVVAGFDDVEELDVVVARVGPAVLSIGVLTSAQNLSPDATGRLTSELARVVADEVGAALDRP